jgi:hypothetical protein
MKKLLFTFVVTLLYLNASAADEKPFLVKTFTSSSVKDVNVSTSGGGISVSGTAGSESRVEVYIRPSNSSNGRTISNEEINERLERYIFSVKQEGSTIACVAKAKDNKMNWKEGLSITFKIFVPKNVSTDLNTSGGGINLTGLKGNLRFRTSGGGLNLTDLDGTIAGSTSGGGIKLINCDNKVDVQTSGGGIRAEGCDGDIKLVTSGGGITLKHLTGRIDAVTSGGGIDIDGIKGNAVVSTSGGSINLEGVSGNMKASTSGGGINAEIVSLDENLSLNTSAGSVNLKLPSNRDGLNVDIRGNRVDFENLSNFEGRKDRNTLQGTINGGGKNVKISASSGHVNISR